MKAILAAPVLGLLLAPTGAALFSPIETATDAASALAPVLGVLAVVCALAFALWVRRNLRIWTPERAGIGIRIGLRRKLAYALKKNGAWDALRMLALALCGLPVVPGANEYLHLAANSVYQGGTPRQLCTATFKWKTITNGRAGVYVERDTTDSEIKVCGAGSAVVLGLVTERNYTNPEWDPATAPTAGDEVEVILIGLGAMGKARNATATLTAGARLNTSATGRATTAAVAAAGDIPKLIGVLLLDSDGTAETDALVTVGGA